MEDHYLLANMSSIPRLIILTSVYQLGWIIRDFGLWAETVSTSTGGGRTGATAASSR